MSYSEQANWSRDGENSFFCTFEYRGQLIYLLVQREDDDDLWALKIIWSADPISTKAIMEEEQPYNAFSEEIEEYLTKQATHIDKRLDEDLPRVVAFVKAFYELQKKYGVSFQRDHDEDYLSLEEEPLYDTASYDGHEDRFSLDFTREADETEEEFLSFLEKDIEENPQRAVPITQEMMDHVDGLLGGMG